MLYRKGACYLCFNKKRYNIMNTNMEHYIVRTRQQRWKPLSEEGVDTTGISVQTLRMDETNKRPLSFLLKFDAGASYPYHNHPAGEELLVLEGSVKVNDQELAAGDYLYTPPGFKHAVSTQAGCILLFIVPEEVEILR